MNPIAMSSDLRKTIYEQYCPIVAKILSISTPFSFIELDPGNKSFAYTVLDGSRKTNVFINPYHPLFCADPNPIRQACSFSGVLIHEMLHKKYTEPAYIQGMAKREQIPNLNLLLSVNNIIEDFTIESRAILDLNLSDSTLRMIEKATGVSLSSKKPLTALDTAIITCWTQSPPVDPTDPVCGQVLEALVNFTDLGPLVPGSVLSREAADLYRTVTPMIYDAIWKSPFERARTALDVYREIEPYLNGQDYLLTDKVSGNTSGVNKEACQTAADQETREAVEGSDAMRAKIRIVRQFREQSSKNSQCGNAAGSSPKPVIQTPDLKNKDSSSDCQMITQKESDDSVKAGTQDSEDWKTEPGRRSSTPADCSATEAEDNSGNENPTDGLPGMDKSEDDFPCGSPGQNGMPQDSAQSPELPPDAFAADPETMRRIRELQKEISSESFDISDLHPGSICSEADFARHDSQIIDYSLDENVESEYFDGKTVKCENYRVDGVSRETYGRYEEIRQRNASEIARFSRKMQKLATDTESASFEKNGRMNMRRYAEKGNTTVNLFSRRTQRDRQNSRVLICLDVSGSMYGNKIAKAGEALVCLVEGLASAGIPVKVITFCENGDTVTHHHYVNYGSSRLGRASLMLIEPEGRNFDGFSIRYAVRDLMKRRVGHDILIIISDGQPNTSYVERSHMLADTSAAVTEAKRLTRVIGIGIDANIDTLKGIYKDTFVEMTDIENLMQNLTRLMEKEVRAW